MPNTSPPAVGDELDSLLESLLNVCPQDLMSWIEAHLPQLDLHFLQTLKDRYATTNSIMAEPARAECATRYALAVAEQMSHEPLALPLARWARGNWAMHHTPDEAIDLYQQAQIEYQAAGDDLSVARLAANLVGVFAECGRFVEAEQAYQAARPEFLREVTDHPLYLVRLEQNYGWLLYNQGRYTEALGVHEQALDLAKHRGLTDIAAEISVNRQLTLGMLGRLVEVEAGFLYERDIALAHRQLLTVARIDMNLGDLYSVQGRLATALRQFQAAQQAFAEVNNEMEIGSVMLRQASLLRQIGARRAAVRYYVQALKIFKSCNMPPQVGETLVNYSIVRRQEGEYAQAANLLDQAETVWQTLNNPLWLTLILLERIALALGQEDFARAQALTARPLPQRDNLLLNAEFSLLLGDMLRLSNDEPDALPRAEVAYQAVCAYASSQGKRWLQQRALAGLGKLLLNHDLERARSCFEQAASIDEAMRQTLSVEELKASFHEQANDLFDDLIRLAVETGQAWQALSYAWRAKASALLDLLQAVKTEAMLMPEVRAEIDQTRQQLATLRWQLAMQDSTTAPHPWQEQSNPEIAGLEQRLLDLRCQRNRALPLPAQEWSFADPAAILANMDADLLLEYVRCGDDLFGIIADRSGNCSSMRLVDVETITDLNIRLQLCFENVVYRSGHERQQNAKAWLAECLPLLTQCYQYLVAPLLAHTVRTVDDQNILIAPCDPLFLLPFAAFWNGKHFLGEQSQIEMISSGALLATVSSAAAKFSPPVVIAASNGMMTGVRAEANVVAMALPESITLLDTPALVYLKERQEPPRILHIAAHSLIREDAPLFTGLQLAGEVLTVEECYELPLQGTELVTLSGCTTASGQESDSSLLAFQSAFFIAGAQRVLGSLWPVADEASVTWMTHFYGFLAQGLSIPQAVARVQRLLLNDPLHSHPAIWAAFACARR